MRKILTRFLHTLPAVVILMTAVLLLCFPQVTLAGAANGLRVCGGSVIGVLFPFFVITNLWSRFGYVEKLGRLSSPIMEKVYKLPGSAASTLLIGLIGGYPVGAQSVSQQYMSKELHKQEAEHLLLFCNNAGPAFIIGVVGKNLFDNVLIGVILYFIHAVSALLVGLMFRPNVRLRNTSLELRQQSTTIASALTDAIRKAGQTTVTVCTFIIFFSILTSFLNVFLPQNTNIVLSTFLLSSLELAAGAVKMQNIANQAICFCLVSFLLGCGGLCVTFQTMAILDQTDLSQCKYLWCKLLQGCVALLLSVIIVPFLSLSGYNHVQGSELNINAILYSGLFLIVTFLICRFLKKPLEMP